MAAKDVSNLSEQASRITIESETRDPPRKQRMGKFGTGQSVRRTEDERFTRGDGRYTDDLSFPGEVYLVLFRSPYAHGRIVRLDVAEAQEAPGILAVYTADDLTAAGVRDLPGSSLPAGPNRPAAAALEQPPLAREKVRYVGEPVAGIVARSAAAAKDAAELIDFDVDELDAVVTVADARRSAAPRVHEAVENNHFGRLGYGDRAATEAAFAGAHFVADIAIVNNRIAPTAMEPRACAAVPDRDGSITLYQGCQGVHSLRDYVRHSIGLDNLRVVSPDVGGGFGLKIFLQCETVVAMHAARGLGLPVKWTAERTESFLSDVHGRDHVTRASLAMDQNGKFLALRVSIDANLGAYCSQAGAFIPWFGACMSAGAYDIPVGHVDVSMTVTNTVPVDAYRGAGRPEATYAIERLVDAAARTSGLSRLEIRRRNFVQPDQFPYRTFTGKVYDSGEYAKIMDSATDRADWAQFDQRLQQSEARGRLRGIGIAYYVEICSGLGSEQSYVHFERDGRVTVRVGTQSTGQGHETSFAQMVADGLGIAIADIDVIQGDTAEVPTGDGTGGSRTMVIAGSSLYRTTEKVIESGRRMAAESFETSIDDIEFSNGEYRIVGTDRTRSITELARASYGERPDGVAEGLRSSERFKPDAGTFPNGCHICELEIDPATGSLDILRYTIEDDVGVVVNPLLLEGQIVGGVAQGLGQACSEKAHYDRESGQLVSATFMDYAMPRADTVPNIDFRYREVPSPRNPLGIKGAGEAGTVGAAPALVSAVLHALKPLEIDHVDMPVTPERLWNLIAAHQKKTAPNLRAVNL